LARRANDITVTIAAGADGAAPITETRHVLTPFGTGLVARSAPPDDGCRVFGPFPPTGRPADPDTTGGYYQPVRVLVPTSTGDDFSVGITRLNCGIAGAAQDQAIEYNKRHLPNENPAIASLTLSHANGRKETVPAEPGGSPVPDTIADAGSTESAGAGDAGDAGDAGSDSGDAGSDSGGAPSADAGPPPARVTVAPGESVVFNASWASCPAPCAGSNCLPPTPCTGSERYVSLDLKTHQIVDRRESIRISWFANDGAFDHDRTGRSEQAANPPNTDNAWIAPNTATDVRVWVVIRDDRGGVGWSSYVIHVAR